MKDDNDREEGKRTMERNEEKVWEEAELECKEGKPTGMHGGWR